MLLRGGDSLTQFASTVTVNGSPVNSFEALVAAIDSAGQRAHRRLPIVIDGLNEAEDPRVWKAELATMAVVLRKYRNVLVICTLRTVFADEALPPDIQRIEILGFEHDAPEAIRRYLDFYKIDATDTGLPVEMLRHPLTLWLFCEITNPKRDRTVGVEAMPTSLTALFDRFLSQAAERIAELAPRTHRCYTRDVMDTLRTAGEMLWASGERTLPATDFRARIRDDIRPWDASIVRAMENEGILLNEPVDPSGQRRIAIVYDALAGHIIADAMLPSGGTTGLRRWLASVTPHLATGGPSLRRRPLIEDIFAASVALAPRRLNGEQVWHKLDEPLRTRALVLAAELESDLLDTNTVTALAELAARPGPHNPLPFRKLRVRRGAVDHPLNAEFLDGVLRSMSMADRDTSWTEWIRKCHESVPPGATHGASPILEDVKRLGEEWRKRTDKRSTSDALRALWLMWMLTSTVRVLRDETTRSLYWFGCGDPSALCDMTIRSMEVNDPYVPERMLAVMYGVAMAGQHPVRSPDFVRDTLPVYGRRLYESMFAPGAPHATTHILARDYAQRVIELAVLHRPALLTDDERARVRPPYQDGGIRQWEGREDEPEGRPLGMDFRNYTLGRLVKERRNYDMTHPEYQRVRANVLWRIHELGYRDSAFRAIDREILSSNPRSRHADGSKTERYGKKYAWIAYFELAGHRQDGGLLDEYWLPRSADADIDPSFPAEPRDGSIDIPDPLGDRSVAVAEWIQNGPTPPVSGFLIQQNLDGANGPWVLLDGFASHEDTDARRKMHAFIRAFFCDARDAEDAVRGLEAQEAESYIPSPSDDYTYAGEVPWCSTWSPNDPDEIRAVLGERIRRKRPLKAVICRAGKPISDDEMRELIETVRQRVDADVPDRQACDEPRVHAVIRAALEESGLTMEERRVYENVTEQITKEISITRAARDNNWESYHTAISPGRSAPMPTRQITDHLGLMGGSQVFDLFDTQGSLASAYVHRGEHYRPTYDLAYLRQDLLDRYLAETDQALIWVIQGQREYAAAAHEEVAEYAATHVAFASFRQVETYRPHI
jgi:hypothetical protein